MNQLKLFLKKYSHAWILLYFFIYLPWFNYLEKAVSPHSEYTIIYAKLDNLIPFNELFVIPYCLWFIYIAVVVMLFFFISKEDFYKCCSYLFIGMTICLTIYTVFPNGQALRVTDFPRDNLLTDIVKNFYKTDTPTNVCPSIHCFNSIVVCIALFHSKKISQSKYRIPIRISSAILTLLIMLSTVFIKQHSIVDMLAAIALSLILYPIIYLPNYSVIFKQFKKNSYYKSKLNAKEQ